MNEHIQNVLKNNALLVLSTICDDGAPWGTPVHFAYDEKYLYWFSFDSSTHSTNITRDDRVFITVFSTTQNPTVKEDRSALYISTHAQALEGEDAVVAQDIFADRVSGERKLGEGAHMYRAAIGTLNEEKSDGQRYYLQSSGQ